jgi:hypothetical protein
MRDKIQMDFKILKPGIVDLISLMIDIYSGICKKSE